MTNVQFILLIAALTGMFALLFFAFSGPSAEKAQARRLALVRGRHSQSANAPVEAQMRRAISNMPNTSGVLTSLIPNPENLYKRIWMPGKQWSLHQYADVSAALDVIVTLFLLLPGFSPLLPLLICYFIVLTSEEH